jgi:ribosome recycling factor
VEYVKVDYYGSPTDLRQLALISVPEPTQLLIKPFDATTIQTIIKAIQTAGLGLNPQSEAKQIRIKVPPLSGERRQQMISSVKQMGEQSKVALRNARRDANKHVDQAGKDKSLGYSEDDVDSTKDDIQELVKKYEKLAEELVEAKRKEIEEV